MGFDLHTFNAIRYVLAQQQLGNVLTIGRQGLDISLIQKLRISPQLAGTEDKYCEPLLLSLGATCVESIDYSDYEGATIIADLNEPAKLNRRFDLVIDAGSLEHVFNVARAFQNIIEFLEVGGTVIHQLPVNNLSGHGFWQFSSDLFYSIYNSDNGFDDCCCFYLSALNKDMWWKIPSPNLGSRTEIVSVEPIMLLGFAKKSRDVPKLSVLQPLYKAMWGSNHGSSIEIGKKFTTRSFIHFVRSRYPLLSPYIRLLRNIATVVGLVSGSGAYSINKYERVKTEIDIGPNSRLK